MARTRGDHPAAHVDLRLAVGCESAAKGKNPSNDPFTLTGLDIPAMINPAALALAPRGTPLYDTNMSGATENRPGLNGLMQAAKRREFDVVVVWRFDRFARSIEQLVLALAEFRSLPRCYGAQSLSLHQRRIFGSSNIPSTWLVGP